MMADLTRELGGEAGLVPVLPGFCELAAGYADYGGAGDFDVFAGGVVAEFGGPMQAGEVAFGEAGAWGDVEIGEIGAERIVEAAEFVGAFEVCLAVVKDALRREEIVNGLATALVPDFLEPANDELLVLFGGGLRLCSGHGR